MSLESQSQRKTNLKFTVASNGVSGVSSPLQPWICLHRVLATDSSTTDAVASWKFAIVPKTQLTSERYFKTVNKPARWLAGIMVVLGGHVSERGQDSYSIHEFCFVN